MSRILKANREEKFDKEIMREFGEMNMLGNFFSNKQAQQ